MMQEHSKKNITYVLCNISGYSQYLWIAEALDKSTYNVSFIFLDTTTNTLKALLTEKGFNCYQLHVSSKKDIPKAIFQTIRIFKKEQTNIVHTHLVDASLVGLMAAKLTGIKKRIHTRHHSDFHHQHYKKGVIVDQLINYLSSEIVAVSKNVQQILEKREKYTQHKVKLIYHGFKLSLFETIDESIITEIKKKYNIHGFPVIGMISRYETGKGIEYCAEAFKKIIDLYPDAQLVIANAFGADKEVIKKTLDEIPAKNLVEIEFEKEISALYKCFDVIVHVPISAAFEAFGQVYIESMAASVPGIFTLSGIAEEYITNEKNAIVVDYKNAEQIYTGILNYLNNNSFKQQIVTEAKKDVLAIFGIDKMVNSLNSLYLNGSV